MARKKNRGLRVDNGTGLQTSTYLRGERSAALLGRLYIP